MPNAFHYLSFTDFSKGYGTTTSFRSSWVHCSWDTRVRVIWWDRSRPVCVIHMARFFGNCTLDGRGDYDVYLRARFGNPLIYFPCHNSYW